jgi:hypothetical protein
MSHSPPLVHQYPEIKGVLDLGFHGRNDILLQALSAINDILFCALELCGGGFAFVAVVVGDDAGDLDDAYDAEEEVYCCEPSLNEVISYSFFLFGSGRRFEGSILGHEK